jgi:hypothetical protein
MIRIQMAEGCCEGPYFAMAVDELKEGDNTYKANGVTYVIAKDLIERLGPITIDFAFLFLYSSYRARFAGSSGTSFLMFLGRRFCLLYSCFRCLHFSEGGPLDPPVGPK